MARLLPVVVCMLVGLTTQVVFAGGLLADRENKIRIEGRFSVREPKFVLVFSAAPWTDSSGMPMRQITEKELADLRTRNDFAVVKLAGKPISDKGVVEYHFGSGDDVRQPWNDGREMKWESWSDLSADIWDHIALVYTGPTASKGPTCVLLNAQVIKGGKLLFDSAARQSYPNKRRLDASFRPFEMAQKNEQHPVFNLSERMSDFRKQYYELGGNPILLTAYDDLGQTEKRKYARRGNAWCSEFATFVYRQNGLMTPDPDKSDVHWRNMREFFEANGNVYPLREVATWPDAKKKSLIKPGSFVSILIGESTHSIIFTGWVLESNKPLTRYVGVSGNNKGMVWPHAPLKLPAAEDLRGKSSQELLDYDQKVYIAVPKADPSLR
jgi:hypothetical protein